MRRRACLPPPPASPAMALVTDCRQDGSALTTLPRPPQTCTGAVACQLMDCLHPGSVNMKKVRGLPGARPFCQTPRTPLKPPPALARQVDFNAKNEYEYIGNYKALQEAFNRAGVKKVRGRRAGAPLRAGRWGRKGLISGPAELLRPGPTKSLPPSKGPPRAAATECRSSTWAR